MKLSVVVVALGTFPYISPFFPFFLSSIGSYSQWAFLEGASPWRGARNCPSKGSSRTKNSTESTFRYGEKIRYTAG